MVKCKIKVCHICPLFIVKVHDLVNFSKTRCIVNPAPHLIEVHAEVHVCNYMALTERLEDVYKCKINMKVKH